MDAHHSGGMERTTNGDGRFGTIAWIAESNHIDTFGRALTMFTTIRCIMVTRRNGKTGHGQARQLSWNVLAAKPLRRFGVSIRFSIMVRNGTFISGVRVKKF